MTPSVLFYVQYLLGIGHLQRALRIAEALARRQIAVTLVSGGAPATVPRHPAIRFIQLPPVRVLDARFQLIDSAGEPIGEALREQRRVALLDTFAVAAPEAVVIEGYPFARRAFRFELEPLIAAIRAATPRPRLFCSTRDIVVMRNDPQRHRDVVERVRRDFDTVLVHGDPALIPLDVSFPAAPEIADRISYTGYVYGPSGMAHSEARGARNEVVVSVGGGTVGLALLKTALAARQAGALARLPWRVIAGPNLPEPQFAALVADAPAGVVVERFCYDFVGLLRGCRVSISQAGYNTVLDLLAARARAVLVPFAEARETEQLLRAERVAALGAAELVRENELSPQSLAAAIERVAAAEPKPIALNTGGATRTAELIARAIGQADSAGGTVVAAARQGMMRQ